MSEIYESIPVDSLDDFIEHNGIPGMKWFKRNGPPYPLGSGDHSASEKKAAKEHGIKLGGNVKDAKGSKAANKMYDKTTAKIKKADSIKSKMKTERAKTKKAIQAEKDKAKVERFKEKEKLKVEAAKKSEAQKIEKMKEKEQKKIDNMGTSLSDKVKNKIAEKRNDRDLKAIKEGDLDYIKKNSKNFSDKEIMDAINRRRNLDTMSDIQNKNSISSKAKNVAGKGYDAASGAINTAANIVGSAHKLAKSIKKFTEDAEKREKEELRKAAKDDLRDAAFKGDIDGMKKAYGDLDIDDIGKSSESLNKAFSTLKLAVGDKNTKSSVGEQNPNPQENGNSNTSDKVKEKHKDETPIDELPKSPNNDYWENVSKWAEEEINKRKLVAEKEAADKALKETYKQERENEESIVKERNNGTYLLNSLYKGDNQNTAYERKVSEEKKDRAAQAYRDRQKDSEAHRENIIREMIKENRSLLIDSVPQSKSFGSIFDSTPGTKSSGGVLDDKRYKKEIQKRDDKLIRALTDPLDEIPNYYYLLD